MTILLHIFGTALLLLLISSMMKGIEVKNFRSALFAALVLGVVNALILPIAQTIAFPITLVTLGLFFFVIDGLMLMITGVVVPGFKVKGIWAATKAALALTILNWLVELVWGA
jgi:putative membrane protein